MKYYLYILKTVSDTLYCGITPDIKKRYKAHLEGKGAKYTKAHKPKEIVYIDVFSDKSAALKEEYRIKKTFTRKQKLEMIKISESNTKKMLKLLCF